MSNLTQNISPRQEVSPEVSGALRTAQAAVFRLEDEFHLFEWSDRLDLAAELRELAEDVPESARPLISAAEMRLESEAFDFSNWRDRYETIGFVRDLINTLQEGGAAQ